MSNSVEYEAWQGMRDRCNNPNASQFEHYGGRGIRVCDRWQNSFENFFADLGLRPSNCHSLERGDVNGNYEPVNCRWAIRDDQVNNKRVTHRMTFQGKTQSMMRWAKELSVPYSRLQHRKRQGWSDEDALTIPPWQ